jgi:anti-anti-sigma regulatory factor
VGPPLPFDLAFVDALMRRQLDAKRAGRCLVVRNVPEELRGLLEVLGLDGVLTLEPRGEAELGEELRVDEVMKPADPAV